MAETVTVQQTVLTVEVVQDQSSVVEVLTSTLAGPQGPEGDTGPQGPAATVEVGTVSTGDPGTDAEVINSGTSGAAVLDFTIPRGATGATGPQGAQGIGAPGPQGPQGATGAAATISVGTVSTGSPGSGAAVSNSGTSGAAVFNFTIPRGDVGATGAQGPQGDPGADAVVYEGTAEVDFGSTPSNEASIAVTGQTAILADSLPRAWLAARATSNNTVSDHQFGAVALHVVCGAPTAGVGFTIYVYCSIGYATGKFNIDWSYTP